MMCDTPAAIEAGERQRTRIHSLPVFKSYFSMERGEGKKSFAADMHDIGVPFLPFAISIDELSM